jgi:hypothetical protein
MQLGEFKNKAIQIVTELKTEKPKDKKQVLVENAEQVISA